MAAGVRARLDRLEAMLPEPGDRCPGCRRVVWAVVFDHPNAGDGPSCGTCGAKLAAMPAGPVKVYGGVSPLELGG